jgi:hypothetical protein
MKRVAVLAAAMFAVSFQAKAAEPHTSAAYDEDDPPKGLGMHSDQARRC